MDGWITLLLKTGGVNTFYFERKNICIRAAVNSDPRLDKLFLSAVVTIATGAPAAPVRDHQEAGETKHVEHVVHRSASVKHLFFPLFPSGL